MFSVRAITRVMLAASLLATGLALAGCEDTKLMEMFDGKKKLPGERKEVFPGGVPGVQQGVPPELMKGYQPPPDERLPEPAAQAAAPAEAPQARASAAPAPQAGAETTAETGRGGILVGNAASGIAEPKPKKKAAKPKPKPQPVAAAPQSAQPYTPPPVQQAPQQQPAQQPQQDSAAPAFSQPRPWPGGR
jgi:hypothetical protein